MKSGLGSLTDPPDDADLTTVVSAFVAGVPGRREADDPGVMDGLQLYLFRSIPGSRQLHCGGAVAKTFVCVHSVVMQYMTHRSRHSTLALPVVEVTQIL